MKPLPDNIGKYHECVNTYSFEIVLLSRHCGSSFLSAHYNVRRWNNFKWIFRGPGRSSNVRTIQWFVHTACWLACLPACLYLYIMPKGIYSIVRSFFFLNEKEGKEEGGERNNFKFYFKYFQLYYLYIYRYYQKTNPNTYQAKFSHERVFRCLLRRYLREWKKWWCYVLNQCG